MNNTINTDDIIGSLIRYDGFSQGSNKRNKVIAPGDRLKALRLRAKLSQIEASELIGSTIKDLDDIETGSVVQPISYLDFKHILTMYTYYMIKEHDTKVKIKYEITLGDEQESFALDVTN